MRFDTFTTYAVVDLVFIFSFSSDKPNGVTFLRLDVQVTPSSKDEQTMCGATLNAQRM
jgi:hypothetical protein